MEKIKTYQNVHKDDENISIRISRMEDLHDKYKGQKDDDHQVHRHDYYTIFLTKKAKGKHIIDFNEYPLSNNQIHFISPGQVHDVIEEQRSTGYALVFSNQFLINNYISPDFINDLKLFNTYSETHPLEYTENDASSLYQYCEEIIRLYHTENMKYQYQSIGAYLKLFLIKCNNICSHYFDDAQLVESGNIILKNFKKLLDQNFKEWHAVSQYAKSLNVTSDHLNRVIKSLTGKSAKVHIQERIIIAAKRLLYFSDYSSKEIAYELGFSEPAHFSQFFKKGTKISPSQFRKQS